MSKTNCKQCKSEFLEATSKINDELCAKCYKGPYIKRALKRSIEQPSSVLAWIALIFLLCDRNELATLTLAIYLLGRK